MEQFVLQHSFCAALAGVPLTCSVHFRETAAFFGPDCRAVPFASDGVHAHAAQLRYWMQGGKPVDAAAEFSMLAGGCSDALLPHARCVIHSAAFRFRDRAYLFAAAPSVGKSTQIRTLMELYPGRFSVICGDRPILECRDDGSVLVYPSPWNGKENWGGADAAPLAGVFCLLRGEKTSLALYSEKEAVLPVLRAMISNYESEETVRQLAALEERILKAAPVYRYVNGGVPDSSRYLYECVLEKE